MEMQHQNKWLDSKTIRALSYLSLSSRTGTQRPEVKCADDH